MFLHKLKLKLIFQLLLILLVIGTSIVSFAKKKILLPSERCLKSNQKAACRQAGFEAISEDVNKPELALKFYRHGCDLKDHSCCFFLAGRLKEKGKLEEAFQVYSKNCGWGDSESCKVLADEMVRAGHLAEARGIYSKSCQLDSKNFRGCRELGEATRENKDIEILKKECETNKKKWACLALGYSQIKIKNDKDAKVVFMRSCQEEKIYFPFCEAALDLLMPRAPAEVQSYVRSEKNCGQYSKEYAYDDDRIKQIGDGTQNCTKNRDLNKVLKAKYKSDIEAYFLIELASHIFE